MLGQFMADAVTETPTVSGGGLSAVMDAANSLVEFAGGLFTTIVSNPVLVFFVGASFVGIGLGIVRRLKSTARG